MSQKKKKKTNKHENTWNITIFCTSKEKIIIRDKVEIENADMRIIKWL